MHTASHRPHPGPQTPEAFDRFAAELDAVKARAKAQVGEADATYIKRLLWAIRGCESAGRLLLVGGPWWPTWWLGTLLLGLAKCLENMEFGHNVMHGQYEWMNDPRFEGKRHEGDSPVTKEDWRSYHNHMHHHYTNVHEVDRDFGYGMVRLSSDTPWEPRHLTQLPYVILVGLLFEWAIAVHNLEVERLRTDRAATLERIRVLWPRTRAKMGHQFRKDYVWWPLLAGALGGLGAMAVTQDAQQAGHWAWDTALAVLAGNGVANLIRNVWTFVVIFCGHFTDGVYLFDAKSVATESRGQWYLRQILGSSNLRGGAMFHLMTGNLSHQIEHHLFPDLPARRYAQVAPEVRAICQRHGVPYNTGSLWAQFFTVARRIARHSLPGGQRLLTLLPTTTPATPSEATAARPH